MVSDMVSAMFSSWIKRVRAMTRDDIIKKGLSLFKSLAIYGVIFFGIQVWQTRNLIGGGVMAPEFRLSSLKGGEAALSDFRGKPTVIYFFAPWCKVCAVSSAAVNGFVESNGEEAAVLAVALSYGSRGDVERFVADHALSAEVLFGTPEVARNYRVESFPTFYFIGSDGRVVSKSVGYTTETGISLRAAPFF